MTAIRPAGVDDAKAIARVYVETWRSTYAGLLPDEVLVKMSPERQTAAWTSTLQRHGAGETVLVAEDRQAGVIGFGSCGRGRGQTGKYEGEVFTLYVHQDHQGLGVGRRLLTALFRRLLEAGVQSAVIWVLSENPSRFFYEAMDGRPIAGRAERLWNADLSEVAYGWANLEQAVERLHARI